MILVIFEAICGQAGWGSGHPNLAVAVPVHCRGVRLDDFIGLFQLLTILRFHDSQIAGSFTCLSALEALGFYFSIVDQKG